MIAAVQNSIAIKVEENEKEKAELAAKEAKKIECLKEEAKEFADRFETFLGTRSPEYVGDNYISYEFEYSDTEADQHFMLFDFDRFRKDEGHKILFNEFESRGYLNPNWGGIRNKTFSFSLKR